MSKTDQNRREQTDRRKVPTSPWAAFRFGGQRMRNRRTAEHRLQYFVDRFPAISLGFVLLLLALSLVDAAITLYVLDAGGTEINPLMDYLLSKGVAQFLLWKYVLTAIGLPFLLVFKNFYMFGTRFRVGYVIPTFVVLYLGLLSYQICLVFSIHK